MNNETRRDFVRATAAFTAASANRILGANDIINIGLIGCGDISQVNIPLLSALGAKARILAVCDIYKPNLERAMSQTKAEGYHDYKDLLANKNIHAVVIMSPDHWHAQMAIDAMLAGKDVDVEKPMALTIEDAKRMVETARRTGRILSVDSEHMAHGIWHVARKAVQAGVTGPIVWSQTSRSANGGHDRVDRWLSRRKGAEVTPQNLDWERFLGSAPKRKFDPARFLNWRSYWDYSGGHALDLLLHHLVPMVYVTGPEFPVRVTASGGNIVNPVSEHFETYDTIIMTATYPSRHTIVGAGSYVNSIELPIVVRGHEATMKFFGPDQRRPAYMIIEPEGPYVEAFREKVSKAGIEGRWVETDRKMEYENFERLPLQRQEELISEVTQYDGLMGEDVQRERYESEVRKDSALKTDPRKRAAYFAAVFKKRYGPSKPCLHVDSPPWESFYDNFLRSIHERKQTVLNGELGYMAQVAATLAVRSLRENRIMFFDPKSEKVVDKMPVVI